MRKTHGRQPSPAGWGAAGTPALLTVDPSVIHDRICHTETQIICFTLFPTSGGSRLSKHLHAMVIDVTLMSLCAEGAF